MDKESSALIVVGCMFFGSMLVMLGAIVQAVR